MRHNNQNAGVLKTRHEVPLGLRAKVWMKHEWNSFVDFGAIPKIIHCGNANILESEVNLESAINTIDTEYLGSETLSLQSTTEVQSFDGHS